VLQAGAGVALTATLASCGLGGSTSGGDTTRNIEPKVDGDLVYFNWAQYLDPSLFKEFEDKYGVSVQESNFDSMPAMMAKLQSGNHYDLIFPSAEFTHKLVGEDRLLEIPHDKLQHNDVSLSYFDDPWYDPSSAHTVPYSLYVTGLGYRADKIHSMTGSWRDLTNPDADGRSWILDDYQEGIGMANLVNGFDLNATDPDQLNQSEEYLVGIKPDLRGFTSDTITSMASGNPWIPPVEWRHREHPIPRGQPAGHPVPEVQGGVASGKRLLRDPGRCAAPGNGAPVHRLHAGELGTKRAVDWLPDGHDQLGGGLLEPGQGRP